MICRFHGGGSYTDTDTRPCPYCEVKGMRPVYDAAMALEEEQAKHGTDAFSQERFDQLATALIHACRRAKEVR